MKVGGNRNYGYGKQMSYAGTQALKDKYHGHYGTVDAHSERFGQFANWAKQHCVKDARNVTIDTLKAYGKHLKSLVDAGDMKVAYAQNLLSSVNVTLAALRGDSAVRIEPAATVGQRSTVRTDAPAGMNRSQVDAAAAELRARGHDRAAAALEAARDLGLRKSEAALMDYKKAIEEAKTTGRVIITEGTKGGRSDVHRSVPATPRVIVTLEKGAAIQGAARNLVPSDWTLQKFREHVSNVAGPVLERHGLSTVHDQRAAYACERYEQITGHQAPCIAGEMVAARDADIEARRELAEELGHGRTDVISEYIGGRR